MAAGDIILTDGTTITPSDLQKIAAAVEDLIAATAKDPGQYEEVTSLTGVTSLPVFSQSGTVYKLVRVALSILKGVDGREVHLQVNQDKTYIQWRYTDGNWQNLVALSDLKGEKGDPFTYSDFTPEELATLKGDPGDEGKSPVLSSVNATSGDTPSGSFTQDGVDENGNPKYILNLTTPKGKDGQPAVFEQGTTTTLSPSEEASVEVVANGETTEGNPKYILNFRIPRGQKGEAGSGTGNVLVDAAGLVQGKKYLFVPESANSASGTFVEYVEPVVPTQTSDLTNDSGFITKFVNDLTNYYLKSETYTKAEVQSLLSAIHSVTFQKVTSLPASGESNVIYLVPKSGSENDIYDEYIFVDGNPEHIGSTQVDLSGYVQEAPSNGKSYVRKNKAWAEAESYELPITTSSTLGGIKVGYTTSGKNYKVQTDSNGNAYVNVPWANTTYGVSTPSSDGLMSAADKSRLDGAVVFKEITVATSLSNLSIANYSIKVTLSSASALSFASTPYEGWECMIDIKNTGSSDITQALPNASGWQCDETSITIGAGKIASISVRYVHGTYVVLCKGN